MEGNDLPLFSGRHARAPERGSSRRRRRVQRSNSQLRSRITDDFALCWNHLEGTLAAPPDGTLHHHSGHVRSACRREPDGRWVLLRDANRLTPRKAGGPS